MVCGEYGIDGAAMNLGLPGNLPRNFVNLPRSLPRESGVFVAPGE